MADAARRVIHARQTVTAQRLRFDREVSLGPLSAVAIALRSTLVAWRLSVYAELVPARPWRVGELVVPAPIERAQGSRIVAIATVPGAYSWAIDAIPEGVPADPDETGEIELAAADVGTAGLVVFGRTEIVGERLRYLGDTLAAGASSVTMATSRRIRRVSAWQDGTGGFFRVNGAALGSWVPIPPFGAATLEVDRWGIGAASVEFSAIPAGGGGYSIEYEE